MDSTPIVEEEPMIEDDSEELLDALARIK